ncbi:MAG: twin-arginine translocation signal domain-containing protein [Atopobiaceae bacterium]|nr:twin-arginine translocation signal domain-containing protein [Atopobiaceae bacterium]
MTRRNFIGVAATTTAAALAACANGQQPAPECDA